LRTICGRGYSGKVLLGSTFSAHGEAMLLLTIDHGCCEKIVAEKKTTIANAKLFFIAFI